MRQYLPYFFFLVVLGIFVGANIYLSRRFAWYFSMESARSLYFLFASLTVYMIAGVAIFTNSKAVIGHVLYGSAAFLMGFLLYLLLSVLLVDLLQIFVKVRPMWYGIAVLFITTAVSGYAIWNAFHVRTTKIEVKMKGLDMEIQAMHLSDIHLGHFRGEAFLKRLVALTNAQKPDIIFVTGDLFDGKIRLCDACLDPLKALNAPVYFVEGNHDGYSGIKEVKQRLRENGIHVLSNETTEFGDLQIIGLNHMRADGQSYDMHANGRNGSSRQGSNDAPTIKTVLQEIHVDPEKPIILLHHSPDGIQYANEKGVDLYLAGHTHAGQLFPVNYIGDLIYQFNKGLHNYNGTKIYVNSGAGTFGPPMRLGTKSMVTVIRMVPG